MIVAIAISSGEHDCYPLSKWNCQAMEMEESSGQQERGAYAIERSRVVRSGDTVAHGRWAVRGITLELSKKRGDLEGQDTVEGCLVVWRGVVKGKKEDEDEAEEKEEEEGRRCRGSQQHANR